MIIYESRTKPSMPEMTPISISVFHGLLYVIIFKNLNATGNSVKFSLWSYDHVEDTMRSLEWFSTWIRSVNLNSLSPTIGYFLHRGQTRGHMK